MSDRRLELGPDGILYRYVGEKVLWPDVWPLYDETGIEIIGWKTSYELRARLEPVVEYL